MTRSPTCASLLGAERPISSTFGKPMSRARLPARRGHDATPHRLSAAGHPDYLDRRCSAWRPRDAPLYRMAHLYEPLGHGHSGQAGLVRPVLPGAQVVPGAPAAIGYIKRRIEIGR